MESLCINIVCQLFMKLFFSQCSASCGGGTKDREVWCLDAVGKSSNLCKQSEKPTYQERCNTDACTSFVGK